MSDDVSHPLLVDRYELAMADAYRRAGMEELPATFSLFVRRLPPGRGVLVAAGLDDVLTWLEGLAFGADELAALERLGGFDAAFLDWLATVRFDGRVRAVPEGTPLLAEEPVLEVDAPLAVAQLAETFLLNQVTLQTMLVTKAARCREAAAGRALVDFGLRRSQGIDAGMKLARAARVVGFAATSDVAGAARYGVAASGTMAHSFVQAHPDETEAFRIFADAHGDDTVLLVDTYDTLRGVERAVEVARERREAGKRIRGVRLDSGDLASLARGSRRILDAAGFEDVEILVSGGLDEVEIDRLVRAGAPIDGFGVGTALAVSSDAPSLDTVYKLVEVDGRPVRKTSEGKATWPGRKQVWRAQDWSRDVLALAEEPSPGEGFVPLLGDVMAGGERTGAGGRDLDAVHEHFRRLWDDLPEGLRRLHGPDAHPVVLSDALRDLVARHGE